MLIYYVEDDIAVQELSVYALRSAGFTAQGFSSASDFYQACAEQIPDVVLLDIMMPGEDGLTILRKLRSQDATRDLPIMMLTAKGTEIDKVTGLDAGADDYLVKPFGMMELVSRVKALLRRARPMAEADEEIISAGDLLINRTQHTATIQGKPIVLTLKEFDLLSLLVKHPSRVFTREQLMEQVWNTSYVGETRTVDVHVQKIRQKLDDAQPGLGAKVCTVRGLGYCFKE